MYVEFMKNFNLADSNKQMAVRLILALWDMMYVEFMKNFLLSDSSEQMAVRVISASWAQERLFPTF